MCDCNLVKIAPPADEQTSDPETTTIEHDQWGRVEGVSKVNYGWSKEGAIYQPNWGWREVKPKRWEPVPVDLSIEAGRHILRCDRSCFILPLGYRWESVVIKKEVPA